MREPAIAILERLIAAGLILLIAFPFHEFSHALAAYRLGDATAKLLGRLTLNPIAHFDPLGGILLIISSLIGFGIGWAKPTPGQRLEPAGRPQRRCDRGDGRAGLEPRARRRRRLAAALHGLGTGHPVPDR